MELFILILEIVGTVSFALSGAMTGLKKNMDIFGVCVLGVTTAVGGGILRDLLLGLTPPATFLDPKYVLMSIVTSLFVFSPVVRRVLFHSRKLYDALMLISDSAGLGIFTVYGARVAIGAGYEENLFLVLFVAVITGVGGGVMRDLFAGDRPYIFVKHVYACAALLGAIAFAALKPLVGLDGATVIGFALIVVIRFCSARFGKPEPPRSPAPPCFAPFMEKLWVNCGLIVEKIFCPWKSCGKDLKT